MNIEVKCSRSYAGNKYGMIRKHSKVEREYTVIVNGESWGYDCLAYKLRGIKLAVKLIEAGCTKDQLNRTNLDDYADLLYHTLKENQLTKLASFIEEVKKY